MNLDKLVLVLLAVWSLLYGIFSVTNIDVVWGKPLMGFAALLLGIVCIIVVVKRSP